MGFRLEAERSASLTPPVDALSGAAVGDELRRMFDDIVASPMPQSLLELCDALEDAFRRGDLHGGCDRKRNA